MPTEGDFSKEVLEFFKIKLNSDKDFSFIQVDKKVNILKDFTMGKDKQGNWRPVFGLQQQDIVFYKDSLSPEKFGKEVYITNVGKRGKIVIPLIIIELKLGQNLVTHAFLTYTRISQEIKYIFPHCAYYFLLDSNKERNVANSTAKQNDWLKGREWEGRISKSQRDIRIINAGL